MGFVHVLFTETNFEGAGFRDIVDCLSVHNPWDYGDEVIERLVGAGGIDITANARCWQSCALRVVSNDSSLVDVVDYGPTTGGEDGTDPVITILLNWRRWARLNNNRVSLTYDGLVKTNKEGVDTTPYLYRCG